MAYRAGYAAGMTVFMVPNVIEPTQEMVEKTARILGTLHELPRRHRRGGRSARG